MKRFLSVMVAAAVAAAPALAAVAVVAAPAVAQVTITDTPPPQPSGGGIIDIGAAFGWLQPFINAAVGAVLSILVGWVLWIAKARFNIQIEDSHRDAFLTAAKNRAASLIADGFVKLEEAGKVRVDNAALAAAANDMLRTVPDAVAHFGVTEQRIKDTIVDMIPQVPVASAVVSGNGGGNPVIDPGPVTTNPMARR